MNLLRAQRDELNLLRSLIPDDIPYVDREHLAKFAEAKARTDAAEAKAGINWDAL